MQPGTPKSWSVCSVGWQCVGVEGGGGQPPNGYLEPADIQVRNLSVDSVCGGGGGGEGVHMPPKMTWNPQILLVRTLNV